MARPSKTKKATTAKAAAPEKVVKPVVEAVVETVAETVVEAAAIEEKAVEKKAAKKPACKTSVCVEMNGLSVAVADIQTAVKKAVKEKELEPVELKIYINAQEQAAYYTVDGNGGEDYKVDLKTL